MLYCTPRIMPWKHAPTISFHLQSEMDCFLGAGPCTMNAGENEMVGDLLCLMSPHGSEILTRKRTED